jgi:hypothetical protein
MPTGAKIFLSKIKKRGWSRIASAFFMPIAFLRLCLRSREGILVPQLVCG